jgi:hypothetical protein
MMTLSLGARPSARDGRYVHYSRDWARMVAVGAAVIDGKKRSVMMGYSVEARGAA